MTYKELAEFLNSVANSVNLDLYYGQYIGKQEEYLIWFLNQSDDFYADGSNYKKVRAFTLQHYSPTKDFAKDEKIEAALNEGGFTYSTFDSYISEEKVNITTYEMEFLNDEQSEI